MSQIAGLQDFRKEAPPADIRTFQLPATVMVFQYTFSGTTYICAVRSGNRGWILVDYGTVVTTVVQSALNVGGEVFVAAATYAPNAGVTLSVAGTVLTGEGYNTFFNYTPTDATNWITSGAANCTIEKIRIAGTTGAAGSTGNAIRILHVDWTVQNCWITGFDRDAVAHGAIWMDGVNNGRPRILNNYIYHTHDSIAGSGTDFCAVIIGNVIVDCHDGTNVGTGSLIADNMFYTDDGSVAGGNDSCIEMDLGRNIAVGNYMLGTSTHKFVNGIALSADDQVIVNNFINYCTTGVTLTAAVDRTIVVQNKIMNCTTGINNAGTGNTLKNNAFSANTTNVVDTGTGTILATYYMPFVDGTLFLSADAAPWGWEIDAATEYAIALGHLPNEVQQILRWKVWAVGLAAPGALNTMALEIVGRGGATDETYTTESVDIANKPSNEVNFTINDIISWTVTSADDVDVDDYLGGDAIMIKVLYEAAGGALVATDAAFLCVEIEYV